MTSPFPFPNLRGLARSTPGPPVERCHVCAATIGGDHRHLLELDTGRLLCSCRICWLLFVDPVPAGGWLCAVPERVVLVPAARASVEHWEALQIPIALVFFRFSRATGQTTAFYPSPAGATEAQLPLDAWADVMAANPCLRTVAPDVEAVLVRGTSGQPTWYIVPIDACYELAGRIRRRWAGFSGGDGVRDEIDQFFAALDAKSSLLAGDPVPGIFQKIGERRKMHDDSNEPGHKQHMNRRARRASQVFLGGLCVLCG